MKMKKLAASIKRKSERAIAESFAIFGKFEDHILSEERN